ncbi:MAG: DUF2892 domain-containing protein [Hydrogenovibrio sp.]|nr:DUF2892 domain-containing protein [Hydrogenovibrio sp.]
MGTNVGHLDRILRIVIGLAILVYGYMMGSWWGLIGLIPLITGLIKWCPVYTLIGVNTCKKEDENKTPE